MMFIKNKDDALLKTVMGVMAESAQQTEEQRRKAAEYLEKNAYAGMRLEESQSLDEKKHHTVPKTAREKDLAAAAHPKDKITHKDVLVKRGVVKEDELAELDQLALRGMYSTDPKSKQHIGVTTEKGKAARAKKNVPDLKQAITRSLGKHTKAKLPESLEMDFENLTLEELEIFMETEHYQQLDELSKKTLSSYVKGAVSDRARNASIASRADERGEDKTSQDYHGKQLKRAKGIYRAADKLAKGSKKPSLSSYVKHASDDSSWKSGSSARAIEQGKTRAGERAHGASLKRIKGVYRAADKMAESVELDEATVGANHLHVQPVGGGKYKVHAVGKNFAHGIEVGEHLSDSDLDDFSEMGGKVKHVGDAAKPKKAKMNESRSLAEIISSICEQQEQNDGSVDLEFEDGSVYSVSEEVVDVVSEAIGDLSEETREEVTAYVAESLDNLLAVYKLVV